MERLSIVNVKDQVVHRAEEEIEQNEEIDSKPDLNEVFSSEEDPSLSEQLKKQPISDLLTAIGLNERYLYANELFDGDMEDFRRVISLLNDFENESEVVEFFEKDLLNLYKILVLLLKIQQIKKPSF